VRNDNDQQVRKRKNGLSEPFCGVGRLGKVALVWPEKKGVKEEGEKGEVP